MVSPADLMAFHLPLLAFSLVTGTASRLLIQAVSQTDLMAFHLLIPAAPPVRETVSRLLIQVSRIGMRISRQVVKEAAISQPLQASSRLMDKGAAISQLSQEA